MMVVAAACGFSPSTILVDASTPGDHDASSPPDEGPSGAPLGPWGSATVLYDDGGGDFHPTLTGDMLELYFDGVQDIWVATRATVDDVFPEATDETTLSSTSVEITPELSYDGLTMYFSSTHNPANGDSNIWMSTRASTADEWSEPAEVAPLSYFAIDDAAATPSADGRALVENYDEQDNAHISESTRATTSALWGTPSLLANVNSSANDNNPMLSADQLSLYFDSDRSGSDQLYVATRASTADAFGSATPLDETDPLGSESAPWISPDSHHLVFEHAGSFYEISR